MPIVDFEIVVPDGEALATDLAQRLADAAGDVLGTESRRTWVRLRTLDETHYAENDGQEPGVRPVFVTVLRAVRPGPDDLQTEAARLTERVAAVTGRPVENVHVLYLPDGAGRIAFGGRLVQRPTDTG